MDLSLNNITTQVNGKIDNNIQQHNLGDCGLISSVFSMAQTEDGAKNIENSININNSNGEKSYDVTFKGINETYTISDSDIKNAQNNPERQYSTGDDDMTLIELAVEKCLNETKNETVISQKEDKLNGVSPNLVSYLFTGETGESVSYDKEKDLQSMMDVIQSTDTIYSNEDINLKDTDGNDIQLDKNKEYKVTSYNKDGSLEIESPKNFIFGGKKYTISQEELFNSNFNNLKSNQDITLEMIDDMFKEFENDKENTALVFANMEDSDFSEIEDSNGEEISLGSNHAYSVIDSNDDSVTLVNPWDTSEEITINKEELFSLDSFKVYSPNV